jgi:hypothetical protein
MVALSARDVTSGLRRPLAVEIDVSVIIDNQKNEYNFEAVHVRQELCIKYQEETVVEVTSGDVIFGLALPLAAEIDKSAVFFYCRRKSHTTCERYTTDSKHVLNANRKPWSLHRLVTSLPVPNAP